MVRVPTSEFKLLLPSYATCAEVGPLTISLGEEKLSMKREASRLSSLFLIDERDIRAKFKESFKEAFEIKT